LRVGLALRILDPSVGILGVLFAFLSKHGDRCGLGSSLGFSPASGDRAVLMTCWEGFGGVGWNWGIRRKSSLVSSEEELFDGILGDPSAPDVELLLLEDDLK
jgi:hypothetical protein